MPTERRLTGNGAEEEAARYLRSIGMTHITSNYFSRTGEVDLIMRDGQTLVFVEVKRRLSQSFGLGEESITDGKRRRICHAAVGYIQRTRRWDQNVRFDVVVIQDGEVRHYPSAFVPEPGLTYY